MKSIQYAVRDEHGDYFTPDLDAGKLDAAKLWKTKAGATRTANEWGSCCTPPHVNDVVEVEVEVVTTRRVL